jgi:hypothetical protein
MGNCLIVCLVGFPGIGKATIAKSLAHTTGATIVDNHWINDPILRLVVKDGATAVPDAVWPQVAEVRGAVLDAISTFAPPGASFIFTLAGADEYPDDRRANGAEESSSIPSKRSPMSGPIVRWDPRVPGALTLDVTNLAADAAAAIILAHVNAGMRR